MTPRILNIHAKAYKQSIIQKRDYDNYIAYLQGAYVRDALISTVGNMFKKKGQKPIEYPDRPYEMQTKSKREVTEEDKELQRQAFWQSLFDMQANFERHNKGKDE